MEKKKKQDRIKLSINLPSMALKSFIEKALQDDTFFESAIENPFAALKDSGVRLDTTKFSPGDLANFFGALAGVKELIKNKKIKEITFEKIFGQTAEVIGTTLMAETQKGMWTQFNRNAFADKEICASVRINFGKLQSTYQNIITKFDRRINLLANINQEQYVLSQARLEIDMAGKTEQFSETDRGVTFHFDANQGIGSTRSSKIDTYSTKNFSGLTTSEGLSTIEQLMNGPLISPVDLAAISSQIETYTRIAEQTEGI